MKLFWFSLMLEDFRTSLEFKGLYLLSLITDWFWILNRWNSKYFCFLSNWFCTVEHSFVIFWRLFELNCRSLKILMFVFSFCFSFWCKVEFLLGLCLPSILLILDTGFEYWTPFICLLISSRNFFYWILFFIFYSKIWACFCKDNLYSFSFFWFF